MIVEACLAIGHFYFRHMAACAILLLNWTRFDSVLTGRGSGCALKGMARQTFGVISRSVRN
jgi:hypothetical protein